MAACYRKYSERFSKENGAAELFKALTRVPAEQETEEKSEDNQLDNNKSFLSFKEYVKKQLILDLKEGKLGKTDTEVIAEANKLKNLNYNSEMLDSIASATQATLSSSVTNNKKSKA